ncbi:hypothetical protein [Acetobacter oeni]|uniref:Glycosyltransferase RgtA/B/C/D-like domain-containing protein n=1 Tax=Acetobacter oeni TaxID=304077 RepID=A0A511XJ94_9PROT|nr:hypothetical protein [Acetobacter oeni]MBB3882815.1 hypothetical protein [Acetobacter oeni]NHO18904.1 hypothetical protein [Acetobacter oeni]GEN62998.1 hypothetical protein AOE01nite_12220 [Acetobacter oeni]
MQDSSVERTLAVPPSPAAKVWRNSFLITLVGAIILFVPTLLNRDVFFYWDTPTYINGAGAGVMRLLGDHAWLMPAVSQENPYPTAPGGIISTRGGVYLAGRSVYYGALLFASILAGSLMIAAAVQALVVSFTILLFFRAFLPGRVGYALVCMAVLTIVTPLGYFTGLMMPDIFASVTILLIVTLLCGWDRLSRGDRMAAFVILSFAMLAHNSHPPLAVLLVMTGYAFARLGRLPRAPLIRPAMLVLAAVCVGLTGEVVFTRVATHAVGSPPVRLPFLSAHLQEMGPGTTYLKNHCPQAHFEICNDRVKLPVDWRDFMFSTSPATGVFALAGAPAKRRISDEQVTFALAVLKDQPVATVMGLSAAFAEQLAMFRVQEIYILDAVAPRLPPKESRRAMQSVVASPGDLEQVLTAVTYTALILSVLVLAVIIVRTRTSRSAAGPGTQLWPATALVIAGLAINAAVCGIVASPYDRFQARVIWLLPLLALVHLAARGQASGRASRPVSTASGRVVR